MARSFLQQSTQDPSISHTNRTVSNHFNVCPARQNVNADDCPRDIIIIVVRHRHRRRGIEESRYVAEGAHD